ncbi:sensor histidine kinase, putative [Oceanicola granulosus HTCC2516]|uniref:histidine kinase n=1 Tax=Oceanicola granulosus (strain ATCC BAA-861 / DSM 15982 / KCTC 12143 / HTCC2516) TaxID=314256 RepID=Q2CB24_OCEGH|nr:sensor histidine kinase, putative [Oceanicola granulosus HTCC2516]
MDEVIGRPVTEIVHFDGHPDWFEEGRRHCRDAPEMVFEALDGNDREYEVTLAPIRQAKRRQAKTDWSVVLRDITERKAVARRLEVVVDEMRHRLKNTLGIVTGMARQTLSEPDKSAFVDRLHALSHAHDALFRENWESVGLHELLTFAQRAAGGPGRLRYDAPNVALSSQRTMGLSMAFHELVTNALKYGALSVPGGHVEITCAPEPGDAGKLRLIWSEHGGPIVQEPTRIGFGTRMIRMVLGSDGARIDFRFPPEGLRCEVRFDPQV